MRKKNTNESRRDEDNNDKFCEELINLFVPRLRLALLFLGRLRFKDMIARVLGVYIHHNRQEAKPKSTMEKENEEEV
ncbi:MAG: hypothetical protein PHR77_04705 [Kiritimatiellae bacterium]|nr:hypothetical protein [Kiritimatiellia bacterium]MDD5519472.1 hypothetical protein [Kiritimatiellia bacterium]